MSRVAAVYGGAAFVTLQVADLVFPHLGLPPWTVTLVVALSLVGLPVALALAWAFEATPDGVRRARPAGAHELNSILAQPRARRWAAGMAGLAGLALLGVGAWWTLSGAGADTAYDSIAVLPFANLSGEPSEDYFGDGLAEELLNALAGIQGLKVAARTSSFAFKHTSADIRAIGDTLGVTTVLEGSVRRSEGRVRINAQLVDTRTGYQVWASTYDRPLSALFTLQDAITAEIVGALRPRLGPSVAADLYRGSTANVEAYDLYLRGRQKWATRSVPLLREAVLHFEQAVALDSSFALAWSGLADALDALAWRTPDARGRVPEAKRAAQIAVSLDPLLAEGWASLGVLASDFDHDWKLAELALRRAIQLKPSYAEAQLWLGAMYRVSGRAGQSVGPFRAAIELDPLARLSIWSYAHTLVELGDSAEALQLFLRLHSHRPSSESALQLVLYATMFGLDQEEAATYAREWAAIAQYVAPEQAEVVGRAVFNATLRRDARRTLERIEATGVEVTRLLAAIGEFEAAFDRLERMAATGDPTIVEFLADPVFKPVRGHPRFMRLREHVQLERH